MLTIRWRCRTGVRLAPDSDKVARLVVDGARSLALPAPPQLARQLIELNRGVAEETIVTAAGGDSEAIARALDLVARLRRNGFLVAGLYWGERRLATLRPRAADFTLPATVAPPARRQPQWRLAPFAWLRREDRGWVLEEVHAGCDVAIEHADLVGWLHDNGAGTPDPESAQSHVLALLARLGFVNDAADGGGAAAGRRTWEFHDRVFHARSRGMGAPVPAVELLPDRDRPGPPPAIRAPYDGETVALPVPDVRASRPLASVMERRRSRRRMGDPPVSLAQVAALLHGVARVTERLPGGYVRRPYPSGGGVHELEFYVAVRECRGLAAGFYHYRSEAHVLTRLPGVAAVRAAAGMIDYCALAWSRPDQPSPPPQCLVVLSSRLPQVAWKYNRIAYRLSLLAAGVVLQSLYLVATDLGLNGCAAGSGDSALFAQATGVSTWEETSIAEFGFGSRPAGAAAEDHAPR